MVGKIYPRVIVDRVRKVTEGLSEDEQEGFKTGRGCVDQIFTLKNRVNKEALRRVLIIYDVDDKPFI